MRHMHPYYLIKAYVSHGQHCAAAVPGRWYSWQDQDAERCNCGLAEALQQLAGEFRHLPGRAKT